MLLLDLLAAFDTLDHHIFLHRLSSTFNIVSVCVSARKWISSYLSGHYCRVFVGGDLSASVAADGPNDSRITSSEKFVL